VKTLTSSGDVNGRQSQMKTFVQWRLVETENVKCVPAEDKIITLFFIKLLPFITPYGFSL
jgi:hypothetical protein